MSESAMRSDQCHQEELRAGGRPKPRPPCDEPSVIVVMDPPAETTIGLPVAPALPIEPNYARLVFSRDFTAETIRFEAVRPTRRARLMWMAGIGIVLAALTTAAWLGVSSASSGQSYASTPAVQPVSTRAADVLWLPRVKPFEETTSGGELMPGGKYAKGGVAASPRVSISRFELTRGDTSRRQLRVAVRRAISKMKSCFAQEPREALAYPFTLPLSLRLRPSGRVKWLKGVSGSGGSSAVRHCIESAFRATSFPPSKAGVVLNTELLFQSK